MSSPAHAILPHKQLANWIACFLSCAGFLLLTVDLVVSTLVFGVPIFSAPLFLFKWVAVAAALCLFMGGALALPPSLPGWARALPTIVFTLAYLALLASILVSTNVLPFAHDRTLSQDASALFLAALGVLLLSVPLSILALARSLRGRRSAGSPSRAS
jgi:hypothetical protein